MLHKIGYTASLLMVLGLLAMVLGFEPEQSRQRPATTVIECNEDARSVTRYDRHGDAYQGCEDIDDSHHARAYVDPRDEVRPRALARYIASHVREMNVRPWHRIGAGPLKGCAQHVGDTTWVVCRDGSVYSS